MNNSKIVLSGIFILFVGLHSSAQSVRPIGSIDMIPNINATITNTISELRMGILTGVDISRQHQSQLGQQKIRSGKATTRFVSSLDVTQRWINNYLQRAGIASPADQQKTSRYLQNIVVQFKQQLANKSLAPNDYADGYALALTTVYEIYKGESVNQLSLKAISNQIRRDLIKSAEFQGKSDEEKQVTFERYAVYALDTLDQYVKGNKSNASSKANFALTKLTGLGADQISITSKGIFDRNVVNGQEIRELTTFNRDNRILMSSAEMCYRHQSVGCSKYFEGLMAEFDAEVKHRGGQTNDVAWANAMAFAFAYEIYTDGKIKLSDLQLMSVLEWMRKEISTMVDYQSLSNDEKQKYYETTALEPMWLYDAYRNGLRNGFSQYHTKGEIKREAESWVALLFKPNRIEDYKLTGNGFIKK